MSASGTHVLPRAPWKTSWALALRDKWVADPRFQRWAAAFPLTRWIVRRRANELFDLCAGFVYSQTLLACVRVGLFDTLARAPGPLTLAQLAPRIGLAPDPAARLLAAAIALRLVERRGKGAGEGYGLGMLGAALAGNPGVSAMVEHHALLYADLRDPVALLRGERAGTNAPELSRYWAYADAARPAELPPEQVASYTALMSASQPLVTAAILDSYSFSRHRCLLDVGGGDGTFLCAVAHAAPDLRLMLFDLPAVTSHASARFAAAGLSARASVHGGDFVADDLPKGADIVSLVRVAFDHPDDKVLALLRAVHRALPPGGTVLLAEPMAATPGAERMGDAYFSFYLLAMGRGRSRTADQLCDLLLQAGYDSIECVNPHIPLHARVISARKPSQM